MDYQIVLEGNANVAMKMIIVNANNIEDHYLYTVLYLGNLEETNSNSSDIGIRLSLIDKNENNVYDKKVNAHL